MADWYYGLAGQQNGPIDESEMRGLIASGRVNRQTIIWSEGMDEWKPLGEVPEWASQVVEAPQEQGAYPPQQSPYASPQAPGQPAVHLGPTLTVPNSGMAIASLACGIGSLVLLGSCLIGIVAAIPGAICGHMALKQIKEALVPMGGRGMAIAGLVTSYLTILATVCIGIAILVFARDMP